MVGRKFGVWTHSKLLDFGPFPNWRFRHWLLLLLRNGMFRGVRLNVVFWKSLILLKIDESLLTLPASSNSRQLEICYSRKALLYISTKCRISTLSLSSLIQNIWNLSSELENRFFTRNVAQFCHKFCDSCFVEKVSDYATCGFSRVEEGDFWAGIWPATILRVKRIGKEIKWAVGYCGSDV